MFESSLLKLTMDKHVSTIANKVIIDSTNFTLFDHANTRIFTLFINIDSFFVVNSYICIYLVGAWRCRIIWHKCKFYLTKFELNYLFSNVKVVLLLSCDHIMLILKDMRYVFDIDHRCRFVNGSDLERIDLVRSGSVIENLDPDPTRYPDH